MNRRLPVLLASLLLACGESNSGTEASSGEVSTGSTTSDATSDATAASSTVAPTTGATATDTTTDTTTTASTDTDVGTTGEPAWCYGWEGAGGSSPYLELHGLDEAKLVDGGTITLQCGGQGSFMFGLYPSFGGFTPPGDQITFDVVVDVAGHNTNPAGHFYSVSDSGYYVGCDPILGGVLGVVPVIPPDNEDLLTLDGLVADFHVVLHTSQGDVTVDLTLTLVAKDDGSWGFCGQG